MCSLHIQQWDGFCFDYFEYVCNQKHRNCRCISFDCIQAMSNAQQIFFCSNKSINPISYWYTKLKLHSINAFETKMTTNWNNLSKEFRIKMSQLPILRIQMKNAQQLNEMWWLAFTVTGFWCDLQTERRIFVSFHFCYYCHTAWQRRTFYYNVQCSTQTYFIWHMTVGIQLARACFTNK